MTTIGAPPRMGRNVNLHPIERLGRIAVGGAGVAGGLVLLVLNPSALTVVLAVLLSASGGDLVITGARGYCPLYAWLARRRQRSGTP